MGAPFWWRTSSPDPGLGTVLREAVQYRDYPMLQGVFLLSAVLVLLSLAAADVVNRRLDGEEEGP